MPTTTLALVRIQVWVIKALFIANEVRNCWEDSARGFILLNLGCSGGLGQIDGDISRCIFSWIALDGFFHITITNHLLASLNPPIHSPSTMWHCTYYNMRCDTKTYVKISSHVMSYNLIYLASALKVLTTCIETKG